MSRDETSEDIEDRERKCRYNWQTAGSLGWPVPLLKCKYIFELKYTDAILSSSTLKLLWFEITKMLIAVIKKQFIVLFVVIFGTLSFFIRPRPDPQNRCSFHSVTGKVTVGLASHRPYITDSIYRLDEGRWALSSTRLRHLVALLLPLVKLFCANVVLLGS